MAPINPRESPRRKKRTASVASGLIAAGVLITGVYAIRHPYTFLRALSQTPAIGPNIGVGIRRYSHFLHNVGQLKTTALNRLSRVNVLERMGSVKGRMGLGDDLHQWMSDVGQDYTAIQRTRHGRYTEHLTESDRSQLEFMESLHLGTTHISRQIEHLDTPTTKMAPLVNEEIVGAIIDGIASGATRAQMGGISRIASKLGIDIPDVSEGITVAKVMLASGDIDDDVITAALREAAGGPISEAERKILQPIANEWNRGIEQLAQGRVGEAFLDDIFKSIRLTGEAIKSVGDRGLKIQDILDEDAYKRGMSILQSEVDPLVRMGGQAGKPVVTDLRLAATQILESTRYWEASFKIPFANINPISIIAPAGRQLRGQVHYWTPEGLPHELHASYGKHQGTQQGVWLIGGKLWGFDEVGGLIHMEDLRGVPRKHVAIEAKRYREMFSTMSGGTMGGSAHSNVLREMLDAAIEGKPVERTLTGLLDVFDAYQSRQSVFTRLVSFMSKDKWRPTNYYPPTFFQKLMGGSPEEAEALIGQLARNENFDEDRMMQQFKGWMQSGVQGPIHEDAMDTGIGRFINRISERLHIRAESQRSKIESLGKETETRSVLAKIAGLENEVELNEAAASRISKLAPQIGSHKKWINDRDFITDLMDALTNEHVTGDIIHEAIGEAGGGTENLNELRRVMQLWGDHKHDMLHELYTVGQGTQAFGLINPMEHPQMFSFAERAELALQRTVAGTTYLDPEDLTKSNRFRLMSMRSINDIDNAIQASSTSEVTSPLKRFLFGPRVEDEVFHTETGRQTFSAGANRAWKHIQTIRESRKVFGINTDVGLSGYMDYNDELRYGSLYNTSRSVGHMGGGPGYEIGVVAETYYDPAHYARAAHDELTYVSPTFRDRFNKFLDNDREFGEFVANEWGLLKKGARYLSEDIQNRKFDIVTGYFRQFFPNHPKQVTAASVSLYNVASSLSHMLDPIGLGFGSRTYASGPGGIMSSMFFNRALPLIGMAMLYNWTDRELEAVTGSGLDDIISKQIAGARVGVAAFRDITGQTAATKYMYETFPGMGMVGKELVGTLPIVGDLGLNIGLDESAAELREFYSAGYVPVRSGRWWLASKTPWGGGRIAGYQPNWYVRERDDIVRTEGYQSAERLHSIIPSVMPGPGWNPLSPLAGLLDPYWKERYYYKERPYPLSGPLMNPTSPGSGIVNATFGAVLKPQIPLHRDEMREARESLASVAPAYEYGTDGDQWNSGGMGMLGFQDGGTPALSSGGGQIAMAADPLSIRIGNHTTATYMENSMWSPYNTLYQLGMAEYQATEVIGLRGFAFSIAKENYGTKHPILEGFNVGSIEQSWWGANIGSGPLPAQAMQETTELLRRFWPHERREVNQYNPLRNTQPTWMPDGTEYFEDFLHGDPYNRGKVPREGILAGEGFESMWADELGDMMYRGPRASVMGYDYEKQLNYFLGIDQDTRKGGVDYAAIGDVIHQSIQTKMANAGVLVEAERFVRDPDSGATGHIDIIADFGRGEEIIEVKSLSSNRFENLPAGGYEEHISQLNFYLKQQGQSAGYLFYVSMADRNQTQMIEVDYDPARYARDVSRARRAQEEAQSMIDSGEVSSYQNYSATARAMVLALSAPWSDEFREEWEHAIGENPDMPEMGEMLSRFHNMADAMRERHRFTPYKYLGVPDPEGAGLFQRAAGPVWEMFAHLDTPAHTKFAPIKSPLESYERDHIYGEDFGDWGQPIERWIKPMAQSLASKNPLYAIPFGATVGWIFGNNRGGALAGSRTGAIIAGTLSVTGSIYEGITGRQYIPSEVRRNREIEEYFDRLKYIKWSSIYNRTNDRRAQGEAMRTAYGMDPRSGEAIYAVSPEERSYIRAFEHEPNARNRETIMQMVSKPGRRMLQVAYGMPDEGPGEDMSEYFGDHHLPDTNWEGWQPNTNIDDYKVAYLDYQGLDAHDFSVWEEDQSRVRVQGTRFERNIRRRSGLSIDNARMRADTIMMQLGMTRGQVSSSVSTNDSRREIQIDVRRDITNDVYNQVINGEIRATL